MEKNLLPSQQEELFKILKTRFEKHIGSHKGMKWAKVQAKLKASVESTKGRKHPVECKPLPISGSWTERFLVIAATTTFSYTTMAPNRIMQPRDSVVC